MDVDAGQERVAAGGDEAQERRLERPVAQAQEVRGDVALQVVDGREREAARGGQRLGRRDADEQRAGEPGPGRDGDEVGVVERGARAVQGVVDDRVGQLEVVAGGHLRHHAAVEVVDALRGDDVRAHLAVVGHDGRARVVAARLDREYHGPNATGPALGTSSMRPSSVAGVRHMMSASSPLSW